MTDGNAVYLCGVYGMTELHNIATPDLTAITQMQRNVFTQWSHFWTTNCWDTWSYNDNADATPLFVRYVWCD